jgi:hypothetical protein
MCVPSSVLAAWILELRLQVFVFHIFVLRDSFAVRNVAKAFIS